MVAALRTFGASFPEGRGNGIGIKVWDIDEAVSAAEYAGGGVGASTMTVHVHPGIKTFKPGVIAAERIPAASTQ